MNRTAPATTAAGQALDGVRFFTGALVAVVGALLWPYLVTRAALELDPGGPGGDAARTAGILWYVLALTCAGCAFVAYAVSSSAGRSTPRSIGAAQLGSVSVAAMAVVWAVAVAQG